MVPARPTRRHEGAWKRRGCCRVAGVDEAGRGCLAGPVVAAAVILGHRPPPGMNDSKRLSRTQRERLFAALERTGFAIAWGLAEPAEIDRVNIRQASFLAMRRALQALPQPPDAVLVDGFPIPSLDLPQQALVHGDARALAISAASIVAKVVRDRMMTALSSIYPAYHFDEHMGYPTPVHLEALRRWGPSPVHRRTFAPVMRAMEISLAFDSVARTSP